MQNKKDDFYYATSIIENIDFVLSHTTGLSLEDLSANEVLIDSVMFRFIQIAENSQNLSSDFKEKHSNLPWHQINGIRNRIVHAYSIVRVDIIYETLKNDLKPFRDELKMITDQLTNNQMQENA